MKTTATITVDETADGYDQFRDSVAARIAGVTGPLFTTDADLGRLWHAYLENIPGESRYGTCFCNASRTGPTPEDHAPTCPARTLFHYGRRQNYNCATCRRFIERYGGLVMIDPAGCAHPFLWDGAAEGVPTFFHEAVRQCCVNAERARVSGVFISQETVWGTPVTGPWTHLYGQPSAALVYHERAQTATQAAAEKVQDFITLKRALTDYPAEAAREAVRVLKADALDRSEKTLGIAEWFLTLHGRVAAERNPQRDNLVWLAVATAPPGFCHVRSTMISTLLNDILAGLPYAAVARRWAEKMHPLQYQRPTTLREGAIDAAEKLLEKTGATKALERRYATLSDVVQCCKVQIASGGFDDRGVPGVSSGELDQYLWLPSMPQEQALKAIREGRVFDHLRPSKRGIKPLELPARKISYEQFRRSVLPGVRELEVYLLDRPLGFYGLVTAADSEAPPIVQWDGLTERDGEDHGITRPLPRNPCTWYFYHGGSRPAEWGLAAGWVRVTAVFASPAHWQRPEQFANHPRRAHFALEGCRDQRAGGRGLFPEQLKADYHGARQVIEAHMGKTPVAGREEGDVNGIAYDCGEGATPLRVRVVGEGPPEEYLIDRWE